jgi:hypothetical protein
MPKQLELTIPTPCHENWDKMTKSEKGRFCGSCQKQVVDFTNMTESQLIAFFRKESTSSVCGRFNGEQLDRAMDIPKKRIPWVKYFFQFTLPLFLGLKASAQGQVKVKRTESTVNYTAPKPEELEKTLQLDKAGNKIKQNTETLLVGFVGKPRIRYAEPEPEVTVENELKYQLITGSVVNDAGEPIPYASVFVDGTTNGTAADAMGVFSLSVPQKGLVTLKTSSVGYMEDVLVLKNKKDRKEKLVIALQTKELGEVIVTGYGTIRCTTVTGAVSTITVGAVLTTRKEKTMETIKAPEPIINPSMKIYPNPLPSGSTLNIKCEKMEEDYYSFQVLTLSGQQVYNKQIWIDKEARVLNMPMPVVTPGIYLVVMTDNKGGIRFTEKVVIQ